jgi:putative ABC transport system permease protein
MLRNVLVTAIRSLRRNAGHTGINVLGLAVGLAACLLIGRYVADAWRFDRFHAHADRIVRVTSHLNVDGDPMHLTTAQGPLAPTLEAEVSGVAATARFISGGYLLQRGATRVQVGDLFYADPSLFEVFDGFQLLQGDPATALSAPNRIVLTPALAETFFGTDDPMGQTLQTDDGPALTVTGVMAAPPPTSHIDFPALVSMATRQAFDADRFESWSQFSFWTYVLLQPDVAPPSLAAQLPDVLARHASEGFQQALTYEVTPLADVYLAGTSTSPGLFPIGPTGDPTALRIFLAVAVFILLIAGINFVNLATARAVERAREVGVRKTLGAARGALVGQFLAEAVLTALLALGGALVLARLGLPLFHTLAGTTLAGGLIPSASVAAGLVLAAVGVGLAAGAYPALVLAGYQPVRVLRGSFATSREGQTLRKGLVVAQFAIAIALIASTGIVRQQLSYVQDRDLGISAEQLVAINFNQDEAVNRQIETVKREMMQLPGVEAATASVYVPGAGHDVTGFEVETPDGPMQNTKANRFDVDFDFAEASGIEALAGRTFSSDFATDSTQAVMINAAAARHFGYADPAAAVGKEVQQDDSQPTPYTIVGVVEDFHYGSLHETVEPLVMVPLTSHYTGPARFLTLRVQTDNLVATMEAVQDRWATLAPDRPYDATFVDQYFARLYEQDRQFGRLFAAFAALAIFVACLGLFGLATHTVQQRTKEIGIRKALGASAASLAALLSSDFAKLVGVAFAVAVPIAYLGMTRWLAGFAYRIDLGAGAFVAAGALALVVALGTVGLQAWRAARLDPTKALRSE